MMQSAVAEAHELSVLDVEKEAITSFVRSMVCDSHLRAQFMSDPEAALDAAGVALSPRTRAAVVAGAPSLLQATEGVDNPKAAFFIVIIIHKGD
jgi:hypothetical protein